MTQELTAFDDEVIEQPDDLPGFDTPAIVQAVQTPKQTKLTAELEAYRDSFNANSTDAFENAVAANEELINTGNEVLLRNRAAYARRQRQVEQTGELQLRALELGDIETAAGLIEFENSLPSIDEEYSALEKEAVDLLQNQYIAENPEYAAELALREIVEGDNSLDVVRDNAYKTLVFQREMDRALQEMGDTSMLKDIANWAGIFLVPFADAKATLGNFEGTGKRGLFTPAGLRYNDEILSYWALSPEEFEKATPELVRKITTNSGFFGGRNEALERQALEAYYSGGLSKTDKALSSAGLILDAGAGIGAIAAAANRAGRFSTVAKLTGNRPLAVRSLAKEVLEASDNELPHVADELLPKALKPRTAGTEADISVDLSNELAQRLEDINKIAQEAKTLTVRGRLDPTELDELIDRSFKQFESRNGFAPASFEILEDDVTKVNTINFYIGRGDNQGAYASRSSALSAGRRRGLKDFTVTQDASGFWIKQSETVQERTVGGVSLLKRTQDDDTIFPKAGSIKAFFKKPDDLVPEMHSQMRHLAEMDQVAIREQIVKPLSKPITRLNKDEVKSLNAVMTAGQQENKWYKAEEFAAKWKDATGAYPSEAQYEAYYAAKALNDIDWSIHNDKLYTDLATRGFKSLKLENKATKFKFDGTGRELDPASDISQMRLFDIAENRAYSAKSRTVEDTEAIKRKLDSGDYRLIRLLEPTTFQGDPIHIVLAHKNQAITSPLRRDVLGYKGGGHRMYRTKWFVKQANKGVYSDGEEFLRAPRTVTTFRTQREAKQWLNEANAALDVYRQYKLDVEAGAVVDLADVQRAIEDSPFQSMKQLDELVDSGELDLAERLEVVYDKGLPSAYDGNPNGLWQEEIQDLDATGDWAVSTGRLYYGKRSEGGLQSPLEYKDIVVDPLTALNKGIEHAIRIKAFGPYFRRSIDDWVRVATPYIDRTRSGNLNGSAEQIFYGAELSENLKVNNPQLYNSLTTNRKILMETMGRPTPTQEKFAAGKRNLAAFVEDTLGDVGTGLVKKADDIFDKNPVNAINSLVFDAWLGMFDPSQMIVQTQTALAATTLSPVYGSRALTMLPAFRWALVNRSDNLLDYISKNGKALHGQDPQDFKDMVRAYEKSGWNSVGGEIMYISNHANGIGNGVAANTVKAAREKGRMFFNEAERVNRIVAWQIAWKETRDKFPKLAANSDEFARIVAQRTSDYSINMTQVSNAQIQNGAWSIPTRFLGYQMRLLEAMLPKGLGGSKAFDAGQKFRLALGQAFFYGAAGIPAGSAISYYIRESHRNATGQDLDLVQAKALESGAIDSLIYALSGGEINTDFADRAGSGRGWDDLWARLSNGRLSSFLGVALGPTGSFGDGYAESVARVMRYFNDEINGELTPEDLDYVFNELVVDHVSMMRRASKAAWIYRYGQVVDPKSGRPMYDANKLEAAAAALGIPLWEDSERSRMYVRNVKFDEEVKDVSKQLAELRRKTFEAMAEGDTRKEEVYRRQATALMVPYRDDIYLRNAIMRAATNELGYDGTAFNRLADEIYRKTGVKPVVEEQFEEIE